MFVTREGTYKIVAIKDSELEDYEKKGFFKCDDYGNKISGSKPKVKKGEKIDDGKNSNK